MNMNFRTIAAVSTPRGKGGIAVIRISGDRAVDTAEQMFVPASGKKLGDSEARRAVFGTILDAGEEPVDTGIAVLFRAPASFTGEDVAEISCHGGPAATEAVYLSAIAHGADAAGPGEFTRRAFLNGKLSLTEAEAVGRLIDADTEERLALSAGGLRGNVSRRIEAISAGMLSTMTALYAAIDYPEEDVGDEGEREIGNTLRRSLGEVDALLSTYRTGRAVADGVKTVICGRPNVGKSSLFNLMTGEDSAIVTDIAGTTRDILRETVSFGGVTLRLADTAGLRGDTDGSVEEIGVERARREIGTAELILAVFDGSQPMTLEDRELLDLLSGTGGDAVKIAVINKADRGTVLTVADLAEIDRICGPGRRVVMSAASGDGAALAEAVGTAFRSGDLDLRRDAVIWDVRQRAALEHARSALAGAVDALEAGDPIDCVCTLAEEAMAALDETDGRTVEEGIVDEIFKRFCVGK
ncbi:MAG: tRNA uridine-5-carboxymethylaminomethyl(34) synthesis GTPase MnmE [Clostridia bacterium]|nr:tRNA uridine-5-carboxymethylaminomethyl(34) synthesis GTPase MnmE [Clostridia bacterium]